MKITFKRTDIGNGTIHKNIRAVSYKGLQFTQTPEESRALNESNQSSIIIFNFNNENHKDSAKLPLFD